MGKNDGEGKKGKKGKQAKAIPVKVTCLHCGKVFETGIIKVVDKQGVPAESHYEQLKDSSQPAEGGLPFDQKPVPDGDYPRPPAADQKKD